MHNTLNQTDKQLKKMEKADLTEDQRKVVNAIKPVIATFLTKLAEGKTLTNDDQKVINALVIIVDYMVKDSSITLNRQR